jgi:hypothetical protein
MIFCFFKYLNYAFRLYSFLTTALEGSEGAASRPGRFLPTGKTRYPLYRRLGGPESRSGQVWKISPPPGFDTRTVQPVASRYTDYATRPTSHHKGHCKIYHYVCMEFNNKRCREYAPFHIPFII